MWRLPQTQQELIVAVNFSLILYSCIPRICAFLSRKRYLDLMLFTKMAFSNILDSRITPPNKWRKS